MISVRTSAGNVRSLALVGGPSSPLSGPSASKRRGRDGPPCRSLRLRACGYGERRGGGGRYTAYYGHLGADPGQSHHPHSLPRQGRHFLAYGVSSLRYSWVD